MQSDTATEPGRHRLGEGRGEEGVARREVVDHHLVSGAAGPLSQQGGQEGRQALRIRHVRGIEVRRKRPRGFR